MLFNKKHDEEDDLEVLCELDDSHITNQSNTLRIGEYTNRRGKHWGYIEIENDEDGRSNRIWIDSASLQEIVAALVEILPDVV